MYSNLFKHIQLYIKTDIEQLSVLENYIKPIKVKKKALLLNPGQICSSLFFVEKGCLRMHFVNSKAIEHTTQFAIEKWWISDYISFTNNTPSDYYIQAVESSEILVIKRNDLEKLLQEFPLLEHYFRIIMQKNIAAAQQRIKFMYEMSKEEFYFHFVKTFPDFVQRVPQFMIASYLGLTPEYVSELRKKLQ